MSTNDTALLERWATSRDPEAFDEIVSRYAGLVYGTCRRILSSDADAEDVTQECFLDLAHGRTWRIGSLGGWLHTVATRRSLNLLKSEARRRRREREYDRPESGHAGANLDELRRHVDAAIESLPPKIRIVVVAHFLERRSHEAIAGELGLTRQAVGYRARKGVEMIRRSLRRSGVIAGSATLSSFFDSEADGSLPANLGAALGRIAISGAAMSSGTSSSAGGAGRITGVGPKLVPVGIAVTVITGAVLYMATGVGTDEEAIRAREPVLAATSAALPASSPQTDASPEKTAEPAPENVLPETEAQPPRIAGRVVTEEGHAIPGARVVLYHARKNWGLGDRIIGETETLEEGEFSLDLEESFATRPEQPGQREECVLFATHPDFALSWFVVPPEELFGTYELTMTKPLERTITVVDAAGQPLPDVRLWLYAAGNRESAIPHLREQFSVYFDADLAGASTDPDGVARIGNLPDASCSFRASREGYADGIACRNCSRLTLLRGATVAGRAITEDGVPLGGIEISASTSGMWHFFKTLTDADGRFRLERLPPRGWAMGEHSPLTGGLFEISMAHERYCAPKATLVLEPGQTIDDLDFEAVAGTPVRCLVIDADTGEPVPGVRLSGFNARGRIGGFTDDDGTFETVVAAGTTTLMFHSPPPGFYVTETSLNFPGGRVKFDAQGAEIAATIRAPPIAGRLADVSGLVTNFDPAIHSRTVVYAAAGPFTTARGGSISAAVVEEDGYFELEGVPAGRPVHLFALAKSREWAAIGVFDVRAPAVEDGQDTASLEEERSHPITLTLHPTRKVNRRLARDDGSAPTNASMLVYPVVEGEVIYAAKREVRSDGDGFVGLDGIVPGLEYMVQEDAARAGRRRASGGERKEPFRVVLAPE